MEREVDYLSCGKDIRTPANEQLAHGKMALSSSIEKWGVCEFVSHIHIRSIVKKEIARGHMPVIRSPPQCRVSIFILGANIGPPGHQFPNGVKLLGCSHHHQETIQTLLTLASFLAREQ